MWFPQLIYAVVNNGLSFNNSVSFVNISTKCLAHINTTPLCIDTYLLWYTSILTIIIYMLSHYFTQNQQWHKQLYKKTCDDIYTNKPYLWLYLFNFCSPYLESIEPFETGKDSRFAISKLMDDFSSSIYRDSISFRTNFGISFRFCIGS
jgi:hypothetical protein